MNSLFWFLYFAGVANNISGLFAIFGFIALISAVAMFTWVLIRSSEEGQEISSTERKTMRNLVVISFILLLVHVTIPPTQTIYMIAASQAGEAVLTTPESQAIFSDLQEIIQLQLQSLKESK
jgi:hypothetical protein